MPSQVTLSTRALLWVLLALIGIIAAYAIGHHNAASGNYGGYYPHHSYYHSYSNGSSSNYHHSYGH